MAAARPASLSVTLPSVTPVIRTSQHTNDQTTSEVAFLTAGEMLHRFRSGTLTPDQAVEACISRIEDANGTVNAFVRTEFEAAREAAKVAAQRYAEGTARRLEGLPIATKDLFDFERGVRNTFGSRIFTEDVAFIPPASSQHVNRLLDAGAISLGKTATPEFGHKGTCASPAYGDTSTPFRPGINSGGSSGGSCAAVASFMTAAAEGSDAGGSLRIPAAQTATVSLKLTYGQVPTDIPPVSVNPYLFTGPITRTVEDAALLADEMAQPFAADPTSRGTSTDLTAALRLGVKGKRIAFSPDLDLYPTDHSVVRTVRNAANAFQEAGAHVEQAKIGLNEVLVGINHDEGHLLTHGDLSSMWRELMSVLYAGAVVDYFASHGIDMMRHAEKMTPEFRDLIELSDTVSGRRVRNLESLQSRIMMALNKLFTDEGVDLLITPTLACAPSALPNAGDGSTLGPEEIRGEKVERTIGWCMTTPCNFSGHPVANVPAGFLDGLPVGMQIIGPRWGDDAVVAAAAAFEKLRPWYGSYPRHTQHPF
ncbi:amidase [Streptomyces sp. TR02-1]|uniref:amidase n=1 Tax=Streptomyces sp. TR02-1 TaxID=3385977 RepID=UPI0039A30FD1